MKSIVFLCELLPSALITFGGTSARRIRDFSGALNEPTDSEDYGYYSNDHLELPSQLASFSSISLMSVLFAVKICPISLHVANQLVQIILHTYA
jgi:hypothetical protein